MPINSFNGVDLDPIKAVPNFTHTIITSLNNEDE